MGTRKKTFCHEATTYALPTLILTYVCNFYLVSTSVWKERILTCETAANAAYLQL